MQIDGLGKRYGLLPSELLRRADTFDLYILDAALSFEQYHQQKQSGKLPVPDLTEDELLDIYNKGKEQNENTSRNKQ